MKNSKNELARSLLAEHFSKPVSTTASPSPPSRKLGKTRSSDPRKQALAQKIHAMKIRQRAVPGDPKDETTSLSLDQKLHVEVKLEGNESNSVLWFRKVNDSLRVIHPPLLRQSRNYLSGRSWISWQLTSKSIPYV